MGKALNSSPKANFRGEQRGAEGVTIYASAKGGHGKRRKDDGLGGGGHHLRLKKRNQGCSRSTPAHLAVFPQAATGNLHAYSSKPPQAGGAVAGTEGGRRGEEKGRRQRPQAMKSAAR